VAAARRGSAASRKVNCRTPSAGEQPTRIPAGEFELLRAAILETLPRQSPGVCFEDLPAMVQRQLTPAQRREIGSLNRHVSTVKVELEARGEIRRVAGASPQRLLCGRA
jgi:hypothetical protein